MGNSNTALTEAIFYILLALQEPLHGYGIMQKTSTFSKGRLVLSAGTLYGAISNLLEKGWIAPAGESAETDGRRKLYIITEEGKSVLISEFDRLVELVNNGKTNMKRYYYEDQEICIQVVR